MKATIRRNYGWADQIKIEDIDMPVPNDDQVLVKVHATTVNRTDCANLTGKPFIMRLLLGLFKPRKMELGTDFAGEVVEVGKNVTTVNVGERVFGFNDMGSASQSEFLKVNFDQVFYIPENIDYQHAAASLEGANYAYSFFHKVIIKPGNRILINGATGGIGSALLQFVRQYDVHITATCNTKNMDLIQSLGADQLIDYTKEDFTDRDENYDFIFDAVGKSSYGKCKPLLNKKGVYISSELGPYCQNVFYSVMSKSVIFPIPLNKKITIPYIYHQLESGKFKPVLDREYPLEDIAEAYEYVLTGEKTGNVVINHGGEE